MSRKYAKGLLEIPKEDFAKFTVVSIPRSALGTITTTHTEEVVDLSGQSEPIPIAWGNYIIVEHDDWESTHSDIIKSAILAYDAKYPGSPIPDGEVMIWSEDRSIELTKLDLLS